MDIIQIFNNYLLYSKTSKTEETHIYDNSMHKYVTRYFNETNNDTYEKLQQASWLSFLDYYNNFDYKNSTKNKIIKYFKMVLNHYDLPVPFSDKLPRLRDDTVGYDVASLEEMQLLYEYVFKLDSSINNNLAYKLIVTLLRDTGVRRKELINLKFSDLDFYSNTIFVKVTKSKKKREVFFGNKISAIILKEAYQRHADISDYIVYNYLDNTKATIDMVDYCLAKAAKKAGLKKLTSHMIRKYFATDMYEKLDGDLYTVSNLLGHSNLDQTKTYISKRPAFMKKQYNKVIQ